MILTFLADTLTSRSAGTALSMAAGNLVNSTAR